MRTTYLKPAIALALFFTLNACQNKQNDNNASEPTDPMKVAEENNEKKFEDNKNTEKDAEFLEKAAEINLEEIKLGKLAQERGTSKYVKDLGKMMETDHDKTFSELSDLALKKLITIPRENTEKVNETYDKFNKMDGKDFDKKYCEAMINGHQDAITLFDKASTDSNDADIKAWASEVLPKLHEHLDHAMACQKMLDGKKK